MLKESRKKNNFSQKILADRLGLKPPTISKYENGIAFPSPEVIMGLCDIFRWDMEQVFQMVFQEKVPESAQPFLKPFIIPELKSKKSESGSSDIDPALLEFLQDMQMPNPDKTELQALMGISLGDKEPTKWFYKALIDDMRNEGLVRKKSLASGSFVPSEGI
jgi:transcriptional regulator with XRE-family HTH domain